MAGRTARRQGDRRARTQLSAALVYGALLTGTTTACPLALPVTTEVKYACERAGDCAVGYVCDGKHCVPGSANTDSGLVGGDDGSGAGDRPHTDIDQSDRRGEDAGRSDSAPGDGPATDRELLDSEPADHAADDGAAPDIPPTDTAASDLRQADAALADAAIGDAQASDTTTDGATTADSAVTLDSAARDSNPNDTATGPNCGPAYQHRHGASSYRVGFALNWDDARIACAGEGAHLVIVESADENEFVRTLLASTTGTNAWSWMGLNDLVTEGVYVWVTGAQVTGYSNFNPFMGADADCFDFSKDNGRWGDFYCSSVESYTCECE